MPPVSAMIHSVSPIQTLLHFIFLFLFVLLPISTGIWGHGGETRAVVIVYGVHLMLIALGNPYMVRIFPKAAAFLLTFSTVPLSETAAVKALFARSITCAKRSRSNGDMRSRRDLPSAGFDSSSR